MEIIRTIAEMQNRVQRLRRHGKRLGFVPTMGYLHEGHLSLVHLAANHSDVTIVSIFVNPTQFGAGEDLDAYPRDFERDEELCRQAGVDMIFYPSSNEMYAPSASVYLDEDQLSKGLCGTARPGHFRGVLTVVAKLFNIVQPHVAVFGQKDAQQLCLIRKMVRDLNFPVEIIAGQIVRESDGLALSSRNAYLSAEERMNATCLRRALDRAQVLYGQGERGAECIRKAMCSVIDEAELAQIDYIELVDWSSFEDVEGITGPTLVALAVWVGKTRLIDNTVLGVLHD